MHCLLVYLSICPAIMYCNGMTFFTLLRFGGLGEIVYHFCADLN